MTCRLCGDAKTPEELTVSIWDKKQELTIKDFIEYYCVLELDPCSSLPQRCCRSCFEKINKFACFCYKVLETQKKLGKGNDGGSKIENELEATHGDATIHEPLSPFIEKCICFEKDEPPKSAAQNFSTVKKRKCNESSQLFRIPSSTDGERERDDELGTRLVTKANNQFPASHVQAQLERRTRNVSRKFNEDGFTVYYHNTRSRKSEAEKILLQAKPPVKAPNEHAKDVSITDSVPLSETSREHPRLKSIFLGELLDSLKNGSTFVRTLENIEYIYTKNHLAASEHFKIDKEELLSSGEIPSLWLDRYKDFKTWRDFSFFCDHCMGKFKSLVEFTHHLCELYGPDLEATTDGLGFGVDKRDCIPRYINGMMTRFPLLALCCVVCSKAFFNMKFLCTHYQREHSSQNFIIFPCLECGHYSTSLPNLSQHMDMHGRTGISVDLNN